MLFKTNTTSHKHPGIKLLSSENKTQLVNQRKQKVAFNSGSAHSPEIQSYRMWWGAASPILNDTRVVCIYTTYNRTHLDNAYIYIYINTELLDGNKGHEETHHPTHTFRCLFLNLLSMGWRGCASAMWAIKLPPSCSSPVTCRYISGRSLPKLNGLLPDETKLFPEPVLTQRQVIWYSSYNNLYLTYQPPNVFP